MSRRAVFGDFQTPDALARAALRVAWPREAPASIVEPTVGLGSMLASARELVPDAELVGLDLDDEHLALARTRMPRARLERADVFDFDFDALARSLPEPIWLVGNPPWVTSAAMPRLGGENLPRKRNDAGMRGLDARTGKANFDVAEWILARLSEAFAGRRATFAFLVKTQVARRLVERSARDALPIFEPAVHRIDAGRDFGASVDACLFTWSNHASSRDRDARVFDSLDATRPSARLGVRDGMLVADLETYERCASSFGRAAVPFRSGVKHDAADVFELVREGAALRNGFGQVVDIEAEVRFPYRKSSDLARQDAPAREVVLPQRALGEDTESLRASAPRAFVYLESYAHRLEARRSSVYRGRPRFSVFGVGAYAFAPFKVAISGLAKEPRFVVVGPLDGRPTLLDDTCYFVPCEDEAGASALAKALSSAPAKAALSALVHREAKRPWTKELLMRLDFVAIASAAHAADELSEDELERVRKLGESAS